MGEFSDELMAIGRLFAGYERDAICCGVVTVPQCLTLQQLLDEPRDIATLAQSANVTSSAMTRLVDGLEKNGWIERRRGADDRRRIEVTLTRSGRELADQLRALTERTLSAVESKIPRQKRAQVRDALRLLRQALEQSKQMLAACRQPQLGDVRPRARE